MVKLDFKVEFRDENINRSLKEVGDKAHIVIRDMADYLASRIQQHLVDNNKVDTGETLRSVKRILIEDGYAVEVGGAIKFIDGGRGPTSKGGTGEVRKAMLKKIRRRGIDTSWASGRTKAQRDKSAAYVMARKIHEKGIPKTPIIKPAQADLIKAAPKIIKKHAGK